MEQQKHTPVWMGKHYYGTSPCIDPLSMAELMLRLEKHRKSPTLQPGNLFSKIRRFLVNLLR